MSQIEDFAIDQGTMEMTPEIRMQRIKQKRAEELMRTQLAIGELKDKGLLSEKDFESMSSSITDMLGDQ